MLLTTAVAVIGVTCVVWPDRVRRFQAKLPQWSFSQAILDNPDSSSLFRLLGIMLLLFVTFCLYLLLTAEPVS